MRHFDFKKYAKKWTAVLTVCLFFIGTSYAYGRDTTDRFRPELWYLDAMSVPHVWEEEVGSKETIVAVLDAGFDLDHEDLSTQFWRNIHETSGDEVDDDRNGYEDDVVGWDFVDNDPDPSPDIFSGVSDTVASHGTVISGIIGATANNGLGIAGINWNVQIMPLRVLNEFGSGSTTDIRRAIVYAVENGADVINLSFTFNQPDTRLYETMKWAHEQGVVIVAAVGNGNVDTDQQFVYPACFDANQEKNIIIGVAATNKQDQKASFSNFGNTCTDISAPGVDIFATVYHDPSELAFITSYSSPWEGTSMAAPMVSGAVALLHSAYPRLTPDQIRDILKLSVDPVQETSLDARKKLGAGRINALRALEYAKRFVGQGISESVSQTSATDAFFVAQGRGALPIVRKVNGKGDILHEFAAYNLQFLGGVRVAVGDVDGDGEVEVVTVPGPGGGPQVRIFDVNGNVEHQFFAFDEGDRLGLFVSVGDINGDGVDDILVTRDTGGTGQLRVFNQYGYLKGAFFPFGRTTDAIHVTLANVDDDPEKEIVSAKDHDDGRILMHDGTGKFISSFSAFNGEASFVDLDRIDINTDGRDEIVVSSGRGVSPQVGIYHPSGVLQKTIFAFPLDFKAGVHVATGDIDQNGSEEIYVSPEVGGGPHVRIFNHQLELIGGFFPFDSLNRFGLSVGI